VLLKKIGVESVTKQIPHLPLDLNLMRDIQALNNESFFQDFNWIEVPKCNFDFEISFLCEQHKISSLCGQLFLKLNLRFGSTS